MSADEKALHELGLALLQLASAGNIGDDLFVAPVPTTQAQTQVAPVAEKKQQQEQPLDARAEIHEAAARGFAPVSSAVTAVLAREEAKREAAEREENDKVLKKLKKEIDFQLQLGKHNKKRKKK